MTDMTLTVINGGRSDELDGDSKASTVIGTRPWAQRQRKRAKELSAELDLGYMELARILYQLRDTPAADDPRRGPVYTSWGYSSFGEYVEAELGINEKKAERLRSIWFTLEVQLRDMDPKLKERIVNLGLGKVRELIRVLTMRNAEQWIEIAEKTSYRGLLREVKDEKRRQGIEEAILTSGVENAPEIAQESRSDESPLPLIPPSEAEEGEFKRKTFSFAPTQMANVLLALQKSSELSGSEKDGHNLDLICTEFLATNDILAGDTDLARKIRYVAKLERALRIKLVAIDPETDEVCYGIASLQAAHKEAVGK